jgi:uncharacterized phage-like protein YoqJ
MKTLLVTGYTSFELGIFRENDPKIAVIKRAIHDKLESYLDNGLEWLIFTGALGFEFWTLDVAKTLKKDYPDLQLALIACFADTGSRYNEANQMKLAQFHALDFVKFIYPTYENPQQLRAYNDFLIDNTDGALVFYDAENETKLHWLIDKMRETPDYALKQLDFEALQEVADTMNDD